MIKRPKKPDEFAGIAVIARPGESAESLIRRFCMTVERSGVKRDMGHHEFHVKPGAKKRTKSHLARIRDREEVRNESNYR